MGAGSNDIAIDEGYAPTEHQAGGSNKTRARRASEGSYLSKGDKRASGELRCETCGKGYKHSSCLTKHLLVPLRFLVAPCSIPVPVFRCLSIGP